MLSNPLIHSDINHGNGRHSCESRNPEKHWIPGQARNDKLYKTYVVMYSSILCLLIEKKSDLHVMGLHDFY